jgi:YidC/Oxa1 family membrane protein insertase
VPENPGQEQRAFWAVLLAMAVLLIWSVVFPTKPPEPTADPDDGQPVPSEPARLAAGTDSARTPASAPSSSDTTGGGAGSGAPDGGAPTETTGSLLGVLAGQGAILQRTPGAEAIERRTVHFATPDLDLEIDGQGARLVRVVLPRYEENENQPVELLPQGGAGALGTVLAIGDTEVPLDRFVFRLVEDGPATGGGRRVVWELPLEEVTVRKTFLLPDQGYVFRVTQELVSDRVGITAWGLSWAGGMRLTEGEVTGRTRAQYFMGAVHAEGEVQRKTPHNAAKEPLVYPGASYFVTSQNKYFMAAIVPQGDAQGPAKLWSVPLPGEDLATMGAEILADRGAAGLGADRVDYDIYVGPQDYAKLKALGLGIEDAMDLGMKWVRPLSRMVLGFLIWLHGIIPNYGFVIVIFAATVNLLFFPLTYKSTKSMRDMAALKPRLDALKTKYKDEPQKMSEATMKLYKEAGVNPLGGCLPILLQMPIFFALYAVLFRTIELRQEPFILWIHDLSQPDVIFHLPFSLPMIGTGVCALPIIMGVTSFFQSKMTMTDPNQKAMMYMMPVMMTVIFFSFPSGLVLYWLTSNLFTISTKFFMKPNPALATGAS